MSISREELTEAIAAARITWADRAYVIALTLAVFLTDIYFLDTGGAMSGFMALLFLIGLLIQKHDRIIRTLELIDSGKTD